MGRRLHWAMAFALITAACTGEAEPSPTRVAVTTTSLPITSTAPFSGDPGRLAIVDESGSVVVMDPDGSNDTTVVEASSENPAIYMQPVWSPDGSTIAWGQQTGTGFGVGVTSPGSGSITTLTTPNLPFYLFWSPDGRHLGFLHNGATGVQFQIADLEEQATSLIDEDAPLYFSWNPEGDRVVTHAGAERVETIGVDGERETLLPTSAGYLAPQWTDIGVFHVSDDRLVVEDDERARAVVADVGGLTLFVANRQGSRVALQWTGDGAGPVTASAEEVPVPPNDRVVVVDTATGALDVVSDDPALGFFWSPDGERLLVLVVENRQITPTVWTPEGTSTFSPFFPHPQLLETTFPFFPQYAQSVSFWSPGSSAFAYAGVVDGETGIWVQDLSADDPARVSDGSWVAWSPSRP